MVSEEIKNIKSSRKDLRNFGLLVGIILFCFGAYFWWRDGSYADLFLFVGMLLIIMGSIIPLTLKATHKIWMSLGIILGWIVTNLILILFFYIVVTPFSLIAKLVKKRFLEMNYDRQAGTYWKKKEIREINKIDMEKQF